MCHAIPCAQGGDGVWPVAVSLSQAGGQLVGVRCTTAQPFPPVQPRPFNLCFELRPPMAVLDGERVLATWVF